LRPRKLFFSNIFLNKIQADTRSDLKPNVSTINENESQEQLQSDPNNKTLKESNTFIFSSLKNEPQTSSNTNKNQNSSSNTTTPNRNLIFKFKKSIKETHPSSSNLNSDPNTQQNSLQSTPRKKIEKLNYKAGIEILENYKAKYRQNVSNDEISALIANASSLNSSYIRQPSVKAYERKENVSDNNKSEASRFQDVQEAKGGGDSSLRSLKESFKNKMRKVAEEKRSLIHSEQIEMENLSLAKTTPATTTNQKSEKENESTENNDDNTKSKKTSKLKKIIFV
jgi:hypothetical protein